MASFDDGSGMGPALYVGGAFTFSATDDQYFTRWQGCPTVCGAGDVNCDGVVNVDDLVAVILAWGECPAEGPCAADLDGNGSVDVDDLVTVIVNWS